MAIALAHAAAVCGTWVKQVDSRVVRIELRNPPPPVNFNEWDGLIRLLFNRKHKTLHSVLTTKSVLQVRRPDPLP